MLQPFSCKTMCVTLVLALGIGLLPVATVAAQQGNSNQARTEKPGRQQASSLSASQAAAKARAQYGGKVLKVTPSGNAYRVRILTDAGRVLTVTIKD